MYNINFLFHFLSMKCSIVNKMVEDCVGNLLLKTSVQIKDDRLPQGED